MSTEMFNEKGLETGDLTSLFSFLINLCSSRSPAAEQQSIAQVILPLFDRSVESSPAFYRFLNPLATAPKANKAGNKKNDKATPKKGAKKKNKTETKSPARKRPESAAEGSSRGTEKHRTGSSSLSNDGKGLSQDDIIHKLLQAIEYSRDDVATIVLCRLLRGYAATCKDPVGERRLRRLVRLDATNHCLRAMRPLLLEANPSPLQIMAVDALCLALIYVAAKDRKITLKVRLSGILPSLCDRIMQADRLWTTSTLLRLICRCCLRSIRNAQAMGREKNFAERLVSVLEVYNALEMQAYSEAQAFVAGSASTMTYETTSQALLPFDGNEEFEPKAAANEAANKMSRLIEIVFLLSKNRRNKNLLVDKGIIRVLVKIFHDHFGRRFGDIIHLEIAAIVVACFRQYCRTKKGKEELMGLNGLALCESSIRHVNEERRKLQGTKSNNLASLVQLQDSLCALCMRCLPPTPFPMSNKPFPLSFALPTDRNELGVNAASSRQAQTSLLNRTLRNSLTKSPVKPQKMDAAKGFDAADSAVDDGSLSSDDDRADEEDESFLFFNSELCGRRDDDDVAMLTPASEDDVDSDAGNRRSRRVLRSDSESASKDCADGSFTNYSAQKLSELNANYRQLFIEFENGALPLDRSPKQRRISSSTASDLRVLTHSQLVTELAQRTLSVGDFVKVPFPDLFEMNFDLAQQDLLCSPESMREVMVQEMARFRLENRFPSKIVYDLDQLLEESSTKKNKITLGNNDVERVGLLDDSVDHLKFESRFESGNLRRAIQVAQNHYELVLSPDINQKNSHFQWFYFEVSNIKSNVAYTFEIINCLKNTSMFSHGMQPVLFSVTEAQQGRPGWVRAGASVCYYRNLYFPSSESSTDDSDPVVTDKPRRKQRRTSENTAANDVKETKNYFSTRFTLKFRHAADVCYLAYHYPYTYTFLQATLERLLTHCDPLVYIREDRLTTTLRGNPVPVITITSPGSAAEIDNREVVLFSARVHPGESNASWIMHGLLKFLASTNPEAGKIRENFVFKIIPMLNPDGVINGSHRCSLAGVDLNRVWDRPNAVTHPTIFHAKGLVQYHVDVIRKKPYVFVDLHGHSRRPNVFMYGNNPEESWRSADHSVVHSNQFSVLPEYISQIATGFSLRECRFNIAKSKESSARVTLWRQFGIERAYTMESTYCGFDHGLYVGKQIGISEHTDMGRRLVEALMLLRNYTDGVAGLPAGAVPEPPPAPIAANSTPKATPTRRRSIGAGAPTTVSRAPLRRSNTCKSASNLNPNPLPK